MTLGTAQIAAAVLGAGLWLLVLIVLVAQAWRRHGRVEVLLEQSDANQTATRRSSLLRDRLVRDGDFASRVRARFTR